MHCANAYGGDLIAFDLPLSDMIRRGKGDDIEVVIDHELGSKYGCLDIKAYEEDFKLALKYAGTEEVISKGVPVMIGVEDPESGSPAILARCVMRNGKKYYLAVIFNGTFSYPEDCRKGSFCLRMTGEVDPEKVFSERIMYEPGGHIKWEPDQLTMLPVTVE